MTTSALGGGSGSGRDEDPAARWREDVGVESGGPPWILGHRGSPREAPENTLVSMRRALEHGLDGVEYDLHACASGEAVLLHDDTLDRTTDAKGPVSERTLPELFGIDAGGWFHARFEGEPLPLLDEVLDLPGNGPGETPLHMIEIKESGLVPEVARALAGRRGGMGPGHGGRPMSVRVASFLREVCLDARDAGLPTMLLAEQAREDDRRFVRDERITAYGVGPGGWRTKAGGAEWRSERWGWSVDEPEDLLEACRLPLFGFNTNEPERALAVRTLVRLCPEDDGPFPLQPSELEVLPGSLRGAVGEWCGRWQPRVRVRNPFPYAVEVDLALAVRGGVFEAAGLPRTLALEPGGEAAAELSVSGGSWSPGSDPLIVARYRWDRGPGRAKGPFVLDAPLHRVRTLTVSTNTQRLPMLRERRADEPASVTVRRAGDQLLVQIENAGGLREPRLVVRLGTGVHQGGVGLRLWLPEGFDRARRGVPFSAGFVALEPEGSVRVFRRWAGGIPGGLEAGVPGRLVPGSESG